ncbi:MAG TPA: BamA/TamA family outer membrane protein [Thermoanaerobaculia bacterium]
MKQSLIPLLLGLAAAVASAQEAPPLRIGKIIIETVDVYSNSEARHGFFYRAADRLHMETRSHIVRKFLLFQEGDVYRPERLEETERNLRAQHYLKSATVTALPPHDGVVDVIVSTQDAWSIAPETQAGNKGGASNYGASISESNLFGYGKEAEVSWTKDIDRTRVGLKYQDPMVFDGYWNAFLAYGRTSDGNDQRITLRRPFYSFSTPWSTEFSFTGFRRDDRLYDQGLTAARFSHEMRRAVGSWGWAMDPSDTTANRIMTGIRFTRDRFATHEAFTTFTPPLDRDYRYLFARFEHAENNFVKLNFINKDIRFEDFNLGRQYAVEAAVSPRLAGAPVNSASACLSFADGVAAGPTAFMLHSASFESRFDGGVQNAIFSGGIYGVKRTGDEHPSTFVGRIVINNAWRQDREDQFFADGLNGLRGYRAHSFAGSRSIVINAEQRFYLGRELLQLYSPGVVAFADAGNATDGSFADLMKLKADVGVGIRIGLPRTPKNLFRLDLAYALNRDPRGKRGLLVSFSSGQAF